MSPIGNNTWDNVLDPHPVARGDAKNTFTSYQDVAGTATTKLAELTCNATFAPSASGGVLTLNAITADSSADATGTATWFRIVKSDGTTFVMDGNVSTSGSDINMNSVSFTAGGSVAETSFTITAGNA